MSIPKEPRQLMINLMYLVLTAMLALNVSAEIINAFFALEKGINNSSTIVTENNKAVMKSLEVSVKASPKYAIWKTNADKVLEITKSFEDYMQGVHDEVYKRAGGVHPEHKDRPYHYKDKDLTTNYFVTEKEGDKIQDKIKQTRDALLALIDPKDSPERRNEVAASLPLAAEEIPEDAKEAGVKTWAELKFKQMPVAAVMPTLAKIVNDSRNSTSAMLNYCLDKASGKLEIKLDKFIVAIAPKKAYLISGRDKFEADVVMGAYSSTANNITISANGSNLPLKDGVGHYSGGVESGTGEKTFSASATIRNPATNDVQTVKSDFKYEIGQTSCALSADMMNVFYIGVDNPISVAAAGVSSNKLKVDGVGSGILITGSGKSRVVTVKAPGECVITVSAGDEMAPSKFPFRAKRIPDPVARLGKESSGSMGTGEFKAQGGVAAILENFDFNAKCEIQGFEFTRQPKRDDPVSNVNVGPRYDAKSTQLRDQAKPGDTYYFDNIKARCPGDIAGRKINPMVWKIK